MANRRIIKRNIVEQYFHKKYLDKPIQKYLPSPGLPITDKELYSMKADDLKWLMIDVHVLYNEWRILFEEEDLYFSRQYGCKTYGDLNKLLKRIALIYHEKTRKPIYKVIITRDKNNKKKVHYVFTGYKYVMLDEILENAGKNSKTP